MIDWLGLREGQQAADVGCGPGRHLGHLAAAVGPAGRVAAIDLKPQALERAKALHEGAGYADRIDYRIGDVNHLNEPDDGFDIIWASHLLHFMPDPATSARELARVTKPGGRVAVREDSWLSELLPWDVGIGKPGLEYRLKVLRVKYFASDREMPGAKRPGVGWLRILTDAGLQDVTARSFLFQVDPPFTATQEDYLRKYLTGWSDEDGIDPADRDTLLRLVEKGGPDDAFRRGDLRFVDVATVYVGRA
jgi:SAM-dependent methyltransferase